MIEEATVDAYDESEQVGGFLVMIDDHLAVPFETTVLGVPVSVKAFDLTERGEIVAICSRGRRLPPAPSGSRRIATGPAAADSGRRVGSPAPRLCQS